MMNRSRFGKVSGAAATRQNLFGDLLMKSMISAAFAMLMLSGMCFAKELPNAPSAVADPGYFEPVTTVPAQRPVTPAVEQGKTVDAKFLSLAFISTSSTFADSYTTLFARDNWLAGRKGVCNEEVESAYLYGTHPTVGRAYAVAAVKSATSVGAAYLLRKHHSKLWSLPLIANSVMSLQGVTQNMIVCN